MKKILMIGGPICLASVIWLYHVVPEPDVTPSASERTSTIHERGALAERGDMLPPDGKVVNEPLGDETEMVLGIRVRKDRDCRVELKDYVTTDGKMFSAYSCTRLEPEAGHPYTHYTDETLETLAYADAEAAARLGQRLAGEDRDRAYQLLLRATALDGNVRHLAWLADAYYGRYRVDGELQVDNVMRQYEIAAIATHFGEDPEAPAFLRDELVQAGIDQEQLGRLDQRVAELLRRIREIQVTVHGEVRHGGRSDA